MIRIPSLLSLLPLTVALFSANVKAEEFRKFTNQEGQILVGRMVTAEDDVVSIKRHRDLKTVKVPLRDLSDADKAYVKSWLAKNQHRQLSLEIEQARFGRDVQKRSRTENKNRERQRGVQTNLITTRRFAEYAVDVRNRGTLPVEDVSIDVKLVRQTAGSGLRVFEDFDVRTTRKALETLEPREERKLHLGSDEFLGGVEGGDKTVPIKGMIIDLLVGEEVIRTVSSPKGLIKEVARAKEQASKRNAAEELRASRTTKARRLQER